MDRDISKVDDVALDEQLIFEQLFTEFGMTCKIFRRVEDFGRWISAGVANTLTPSVAIINLRKGIRTRNAQLSQSEIQMIRKHLASGRPKNLILTIP